MELLLYIKSKKSKEFVEDIFNINVLSILGSFTKELFILKLFNIDCIFTKNCSVPRNETFGKILAL